MKVKKMNWLKKPKKKIGKKLEMIFRNSWKKLENKIKCF